MPKKCRLNIGDVASIHHNMSSSDQRQALVIWFQLVDSNGAPYKSTSSTKVSVSSEADISDFRDAVKAKYADSHLMGVAASDLIVYKNKDAFGARDKTLPLEVDCPLVNLGSKSKKEEALIVVVPTSLQGIEESISRGKKRKLFETVKLEIRDYSRKEFAFEFNFVSRPEFERALSTFKQYLSLLFLHRKGIHASFTRYFYVGGASGTGKTRLAYELAQAVMEEKMACDTQYVFIDGKKCVTTQIDNPYGLDAYQYTTKLILSLLCAEYQAIDVSVSFSELASKISRDCFAESDRKRVLILHFDECQLKPMECRALLRTVRDYVCDPEHDMIVVPILTGMSSFEFSACDLVDVSGMQPFTIALSGMDDAGLILELMKALNIEPQEVDPNLKAVISDLGGVPRFFQFLYVLLESRQYSGEVLSIDAAQSVLNELLIAIESAYSYDLWIAQFGDAEHIKIFLILSIGGIWLSSNHKINGNTLEQCSRSGLFSLLYASFERCQVYLPLIVVRYLNSKVSLCASDILDPFNSEWSTFESISLYSMWFRIAAFKLIERPFITVSELRPGCFGHDETLDLRIDLSQEFSHIRTLSRHINSINETGVPTGSDAKGGDVNLNEGMAIYRCYVNQPAFDGILVSARSRFKLVSQAKTSNILKNDGSPSDVILYLSKLKDISNLIAGYLDEEAFHTVVEVFTDHSSNIFIENIPRSLILITRANWSTAVGPVFSQRLRTRNL